MREIRIIVLTLLFAPCISLAEECSAIEQKIKNLDYTKSSEVIAKGNTSFSSLYNECDNKNTFLGGLLPAFKGIPMKCTTDKNNVKRVVQFQDKTVLFEAKAAVDADGSPVSCGSNRSKTDQCETWLTYDSVSSKKYIDSEQVPFVVIPSASPIFDKKNSLSNVSFMRSTGIGKGDLAVAIYRGNCSFGIVGDLGPYFRLGEMSIASHSELKNPQCIDNEKPCKRLVAGGGGRGIPSSVTYIIFPGTRPKPLTAENIIEVSAKDAKESIKKFITENSKHQ
ncbi:MAG: hypothetical protein HOP36_13445 [Methyloglobulus sp.]|nr:hypothetical protein [Methyloglobulus sp.]